MDPRWIYPQQNLSSGSPAVAEPAGSLFDTASIMQFTVAIFLWAIISSIISPLTDMVTETMTQPDRTRRGAAEGG